MRPTYPLMTNLHRSIALSVADRLSHNDAPVFYLADTQPGDGPDWVAEVQMIAIHPPGVIPILQSSDPDILDRATGALARGTHVAVSPPTRYGGKVLGLLARLDLEMSKPEVLRRLAIMFYLRDEHLGRMGAAGYH